MPRGYRDAPPAVPRTGYRGGSTIADLFMAQGQAGAQAALAQGDIWSQALGGVGQAATGAIAAHQQAAQEKARAEIAARREQTATQLIATWDGKDPRELLHGLVSLKGPVEGQKAALAVMDFHSLTGKLDDQDQARAGNVLREAAKQPLETFKTLYPGLQSKGPIFEQLLGLPPGTTAQMPPEEAYKALQAAFPPKLQEVGAGASLVNPTNLAAGPAFTAPTAPKEPKLYPVTTTAPGGGPLNRVATEEEMRAGVPGYRVPKEPKEPDSAPLLSPAGLDVAARLYSQTGQLPAMGMGPTGAAARSKIINRAAELDPTLNVASNKAGYSADTGALTSLQKQRSAIGAFEETAGKNIDIFLEQAGKVVDTGSPLANRLVRDVSGGVLGSKNQAAYDAARLVAVNEIAKITSNPNLSGQLSDSARKEVEAFNPREATLKQTVEVMRILKRDMGNRTKSLDNELDRIKARIRGGQAPTPPAGGAGLIGGRFERVD